MGHLLATVNPGAVDMIGGEEATLPGISNMVVYICRPGEGRRGRQEFPAIVMSEPQGDGNALDLVVFYDESDLGYRERIPMRSEQHDYPAWRFPREAKPPQFSPESLQGMREELGALKKALFGEFEQPPRSVMDYLADFEAKLKALKAAPKGKRG